MKEVTWINNLWHISWKIQGVDEIQKLINWWEEYESVTDLELFQKQWVNLQTN
jgi:hypothetical protein